MTIKKTVFLIDSQFLVRTPAEIPKRFFLWVFLSNELQFFTVFLQNLQQNFQFFQLFWLFRFKS